MKEHVILRLGHQGDGIAEGPVYAPMTLPKEVVTGDPDGSILRNVRIVTPSPDRVSPPCRHFRSCGGCQLMHASDRLLAEWKIEVVKNALAAHGLTAEFRPIAISPPQSRRRATFAARRTKKGTMAGFHARGSGVIVDIPDCKLLHPDLLKAIPVAHALAAVGASRKAGLDVSVTLARSGLDVVVTGGKFLDGPLQVKLARLAQGHNLSRLAWDGEVIAICQPPEQLFGKVEIVPPPGAFLQATAEGEAALISDVQEIVAGAGRVADLFAGCGTFALSLANHHEVHAVEGDAAMIAALDAGWRNAGGLKRITTEARDLFRRPLLVGELERFDAIVIDPPRAGAEAQVAELGEAGVPMIAYVSCSPASFARDAKRLVECGYDLRWIRVVDQFRWSAHIELVAEFRLNPTRIAKK